jgi:hypothetical protein
MDAVANGLKMVAAAASHEQGHGFEPYDISILVAAGLLKSLGHPARNATNYFASQAPEQLRQDEKFLARACKAICEHWREPNARNRSCEHGPNGNSRFNRRSGRNGRADSPTNDTPESVLARCLGDVKIQLGLVNGFVTRIEQCRCFRAVASGKAFLVARFGIVDVEHTAHR